ncbi:MAG TPA: hypothetical protein VMU95_32785 [Trebonia sp.]|nr:hypothetical protein [Trebonia sp.]
MAGLIKFDEVRALEDAAFGQGATPTLLCRLLFPVWSVTVEAEIYDSEPYALIDRYLEAGIANGGLRTVAELAGFYGLDRVLVDRAIRFLRSIGHLEPESGDGSLTLTEVGRMSVRTGRRYTHALKDRRRLYFDGFTSRPLPSAYYEEPAVTFLDRAGIATAMTESLPFTPVTAFGGAWFPPSALESLDKMPAPERVQHNLPEQVLRPQLVDAETLFLPAYVVRAHWNDRAGCLAYTQAAAGDEADPDWSRICSSFPEIAVIMEVGLLDGSGNGDPNGREASARRWIQERYSGRVDVAQGNGGLLTATLPPGAFRTESGGLPLSKLGSFVMMGSWFFRVWCTDEALRRRVLLERAEGYFKVAREADAATRLLAKLGRQLGLEHVSLPELRAMADKAGKARLTRQLDLLLA